MSRFDDEPRQLALLKVSHVIRGVVDAAEELVSQLTSTPDEKYTLDCEWYHVYPAWECLWEALKKDGLLKALDSQVFADLRDEIFRIWYALPHPDEEYGGHFDRLDEAIDALRMLVCALDQLCYRWAIAAFGAWGGYWFMTAVSDKFRLDKFYRWSTIELPTEEIVALIKQPLTGESEQEMVDAADECDRWIYDQVMAGKKYPRIIKELKAKPVKWRRISSIPGIKAIARRYAERNSLPIPAVRQPGRPAGQ